MHGSGCLDLLHCWGSETNSVGSQATISVVPTVIRHDNRTRHVFKEWMINGLMDSIDPTYTF